MDVSIKINILASFGLVNALSALFFGYFVFINNKKKTLNKVFFLMNISIFIWSFFYFLWLKNTEVELVLFLLRAFSMGAAMIPVFYLHWVLILLEIDKKRKPLIISAYITGIIFVLLNFSPLFIKGFHPVLYFPFWPIPGPSFHIWLFLFGLAVLYGLYCLVKSYRFSEGYKKHQILYVLIGTIVGFGGGMTNFFLWYNIPIPPYPNIFVTFYTIILAYATFRFRLMDIRVVVREGAIFTVTLAITITIFIIGALLSGYFFEYTLDPSYILVTSLFLIIGTAIFSLLRNSFEKIINKYFFTALYKEERVIRSLIIDVPKILDVNELKNLIIDTMKGVLHIGTIVFWSINLKKGIFTNLKTVGCKKDCDVNFLAKNRLFLKHALEYDAPIILDELDSYITNLTNENTKKAFLRIKEEMEGNGIRIILPLVVKFDIVGLLFLGRKMDNSAYSKQDINILNIVRNQLAVGLENAELYEKTQQFNIKMKEEVERATRRLRRINEQLKMFDKAKSEFISIASHQLRTPLAAIKGYTSMILEGDYGKFSKKVEEPLKNVFISSERMSSLVENLLNISRIESGRLIFNFKKIKFNELIGSLAKEFQPVVKTKGLQLICKCNKTVPQITVDEVKIKEVVSNLIDNAIKYTEKGIIEVGVKTVIEKEKRFVLLTVSDTGMGIAKEDLPTIFKKFTRGRKVFLIHTEGVGLGLYFSQKVIEAHKGKIWVESKGEGKGTTFFVKLPI